MTFTEFKEILVETVRAYSEDKAERLGAAIAYYATFSLAPLVVLALGLVGLFFSRQAEDAEATLVDQLETVIGPDGAVLVSELVQNAAASPGSGAVAAVAGVLILLIGASTLFSRLHDAMNTIWNVEAAHAGLIGFLRSRALALLLVATCATLLLTSVLLASALAVAAASVEVPFVAVAAERVLAIAFLALLFAILFRALPDAPVAWRDVWLGAGITAVLFTIGTSGISWYLANSAIGSAYGAAGALVALLVWIYYSAQIFFFGAEFTSVQAKRRRPEQAPVEPAPPVPEPEPSIWKTRALWFAAGAILARFFRRS